MTEHLLHIALIVLVVAEIHCTGFFITLKKSISKWLKIEPESISSHLFCDLCQAHWLCVAYILFNIGGWAMLPYYAYTLFLCFNIGVIEDILHGVREILIKITSKIK